MVKIIKKEDSGSFKFVNTTASNIDAHQPVAYGGLEGITNHSVTGPGEVGVADLWYSSAVTGWLVDFEAPLGAAVNLGDTVTAGGFTGYAIHGGTANPIDNVVAQIGDNTVRVLAIAATAPAVDTDEGSRSIHRDATPSAAPSPVEWPDPISGNKATIYYTNGSTLSTSVELWQFNGVSWTLVSQYSNAIEPDAELVTIVGHGINAGSPAVEGALWPVYGAYWDKENGVGASISTSENQDTDPMNAVIVAVHNSNQVYVRLVSELDSLGLRSIAASGADLEQGAMYWLQSNGSVGTTVSGVRVLQAYDDTSYYGKFHSYLDGDNGIVVPSPEDHIHTQAVASSVWTVNHNFGVDAESVSIFVDVDGTLTPTQAAWVNTNTNTVVITFATSQSGYAVVEKPYTA